MVREERQTELVNLLMDRRLLAAVGLKHWSGPRMSTSFNFNGYNMVKLLVLVGMKAVFKWREIVIFVRTRGCLCCECWTNLKSVHGAKSSSQVLPISEHRST